jgi:hypothetical protein
MTNWALYLASAVGVFICSCHDAPRSNPMDPVLTPEVSVTAAELDHETGVVRLTWTRYVGRQPFATYRVLRRAEGADRTDTVATIGSATQTAWADTTLRDFGADRVYVYRVSVTNASGYSAVSREVRVGPFAVQWSELLEARADSTSATVALRWSPYRGPAFERCAVWRRSYGEESRQLVALSDVTQTAWTDTTPLPDVEYSYWLEIEAAGARWSTPRREAVYHLPAVMLLSLALSAEASSATLTWAPYVGPGFAGYDIVRRVAPYPEEVVGRLADIAATTYLDTCLNGNTDYGYRIAVRTRWGDAAGVSSGERVGSFYRLQQPVLRLPSLAALSKAVQSIGLAVDETDRLVVAASVIGTTTAAQMSAGVQLLLPGKAAFQSVFAAAGTPSAQSPIRVVTQAGRVYVAVGLEDGSILVGAVAWDFQGLRELWSTAVPTAGSLPVGLHAVAGGLWLFDNQARLYPVDLSGAPGQAMGGLRQDIATEHGLPVADISFGAAAGPLGNDAVYLLAPERPQNHVLARVYLPNTAGGIFAGQNWFIDDGAGNGKGLTLSPLVAALDRSRQRLVVLEATGLLQVLDASAPDQTRRRYITQWGRFGSAEGEFLLSPRTCAALATDSSGRIYVADGGERVQVFEP